jgi:hypothetical protein
LGFGKWAHVPEASGTTMQIATGIIARVRSSNPSEL